MLKGALSLIWIAFDERARTKRTWMSCLEPFGAKSASAIHPTMSPTRIDGFTGEDYAYLGYLYKLLNNNIPLTNCILFLEKLVLSHREKPQIETQVWTRQPPPAPRDPPSWKDVVISFFGNLAKTEEEWQKKREEANLSSADDILRVADALLLRRQEPCFEDHLSETAQMPHWKSLLLHWKSLALILAAF